MKLLQAKRLKFGRPASEACPSGSLSQLKTLAPLRERQPGAVEGHVSVCLGVIRLFYRRCPAAVAWLVVAGGILSIDGVAVRAASHVADERSEIVSPRVAHRDSPGAVLGERLLFRIKAPILDATPDAIFTAVREAVPGAQGQVLRARAATTTGVARAKIRASNFSDTAAVALTQPRQVLVSLAHGDQSPKALSYKVDPFERAEIGQVAAAALRDASFQVFSINEPLGPAGAPTAPTKSLVVVGSAKNREAAEYLPGEIDEARHLLLELCHSELGANLTYVKKAEPKPEPPPKAPEKKKDGAQ
jgi:hypothetical protein